MKSRTAKAVILLVSASMLVTAVVWIGWVALHSRRNHGMSSEMRVLRHDVAGYSSAVFSHDNEVCIISTENDKLLKIALPEGRLIAEAQCPTRDIISLSLSPDRQRVLFASLSGEVGVLMFESDTTRFFRRMDSGVHCFPAVDGERFYLSTLSHGGLYQVDDGEPKLKFSPANSKRLVARDSFFHYGVCSPSGETIAISLSAGVLLLSAKDFEEKWADSDHDGPLAFSSDSHFLACCQQEREILIVDLRSLKPVNVLIIPEKTSLAQIVFSQDGRRLIGFHANAYGHGGKLYVFDVRNGSLLAQKDHVGISLIGLAVLNDEIIVIDRSGYIGAYPIE